MTLSWFAPVAPRAAIQPRHALIAQLPPAPPQGADRDPASLSVGQPAFLLAELLEIPLAPPLGNLSQEHRAQQPAPENRPCLIVTTHRVGLRPRSSATSVGVPSYFKRSPLVSRNGGRTFPGTWPPTGRSGGVVGARGANDGPVADGGPWPAPRPPRSDDRWTGDGALGSFAAPGPPPPTGTSFPPRAPTTP